jgi:hypothetical protein
VKTFTGAILTNGSMFVHGHRGNFLVDEIIDWPLAQVLILAIPWPWYQPGSKMLLSPLGREWPGQGLSGSRPGPGLTRSQTESGRLSARAVGEYRLRVFHVSHNIIKVRVPALLKALPAALAARTQSLVA